MCTAGGPRGVLGQYSYGYDDDDDENSPPSFTGDNYNGGGWQFDVLEAAGDVGDQFIGNVFANDIDGDAITWSLLDFDGNRDSIKFKIAHVHLITNLPLHWPPCFVSSATPDFRNFSTTFFFSSNSS
jgi:hypothetical protein